MRYVYLALLVVLAAVFFLFKFQDLDTVTVQFPSASLTWSLSVLLLAACVRGRFTGGVVLSLLRSWVQGATIRPPVRS